jgi:hypothetical protein
MDDVAPTRAGTRRAEEARNCPYTIGAYLRDDILQ